MAPTVLVSTTVLADFGSEIDRITTRAPGGCLVVPFDPAQPPDAEASRAVDAAYYSRDVWAGTVKETLSPAAAAFWRTVEQSPRLDWLHVFSSGSDHVHYQPYLAGGTRLTTSSGAQGESVATAAVTGLLALARHFPHFWKAQQQRSWQPLRADDVPDLRGQTALIVGTGHIGGAIAGYLQAFGLRTVGLRRTAQPTAGFDEVDSLASFDAHLAHCDWLVLACPLNDDTRGLVDARRLTLMKPGAGVVNVARGEVVDEVALADALASGALGHAYLDVFTREPLDTASPLWSLENVIVSPHNAGASSGTYARGVGIFLRNLENYLTGGQLENLAARPTG
ncbi:MAG: D-2-hydroxyacid dehydrogenase [Nocardioides sp.]